MKKPGVTLLVMFMLGCAQAAYIPVTDVEVSPPQPIEGQDIILNVDGEAGSPPLSYYTQTDISADQVVLDIYFTEFALTPVAMSWNHAENIGPLLAGAYDLTVNTYDHVGGAGILADTYNTDFTVIPEPSAVGMIAVGGLLLFCRRKRAANMPRARTGDVNWQRPMTYIRPSDPYREQDRL